MGIVLNGITWAHSRGYTPLVAAAQRYQEMHPNIQINWKKRTLQEFADYPIEALTASYDLLIIDHPWVGCAAALQCVLPFNAFLPQSYLADQAANSVGLSNESYIYETQQWALAIDAAAPVASYRKDLLEKHQQPLPQQWSDVITLAKAGKVAVPAIPIDLLMNFYSFCIAHGGNLFSDEDKIVENEIGRQAIATMQQLYNLVDTKMFDANPIAVAEMMSSTDDYWYCPFAYGYSNYARTGYAKHLLHYQLPVQFLGKQLITTIGGTGIAVSASCKNPETAMDFAQWICSGKIQSSFYMEHGGQPAHLLAWKNEAANQLTHHYFTNCLPSVENGYLRPRYNGYLYFQDHAGQPLQQCLLSKIDAKKALDQMNHMYKKSRDFKKQIISL
jgi:multiple sugar transport system substrate-binding protein